MIIIIMMIIMILILPQEFDTLIWETVTRKLSLIDLFCELMLSTHSLLGDPILKQNFP